MNSSRFLVGVSRSLAALAALLFLTGASVAEAAACGQLEMALVVDQSGSMGGSKEHPSVSDPLGLRFVGPSRALALVGSLYNLNKTILGRTPITVNAAVVSFGTQQHESMGWRTLTPRTDKDATDLGVDLDRILGPAHLPSPNLGNTNFVGAFTRAADLFDQRPPQQDGCPLRAILLLTDGMPFLEGQGSFSIEGHMATVRSLVDQRLPKSSFDLFVTGINNVQRPAYWQAMERYWKQIAPDETGRSQAGLEPRVRLAATADEIGVRFNRIIAELTTRATGLPSLPPVPTPVVNQPYTIPPYLEQIIFILNKRDTRERLDVRDETGRQIAANRTDMQAEITGADLAIETLRVQRPQPGKWLVRVTPERDSVRMEAVIIPTSVRMTAPLGSETLQYLSTGIEFQLVNHNGVPLPEYTDPRYQLQVETSIQVGGRIWRVPARRLSGQLYRADFVPFDPGKHVVQVRGTAQDADGKAVEVVNGVIGEFVVAPVTARAIVGVNTVVPQGCAGPLQETPIASSFAFYGPADKMLVVQAPVRWNATTIRGDTVRPVPVQGPDTAGRYNLTFVPDAPGLQQLRVHAYLSDAVAGERQVLDLTRDFDISPTYQLGFQVTQLKPGSYLGNQLEFRWWPPPFFTLGSTLMETDVVVVQVPGGPSDVTMLGPDADKLLKLDIRAKGDQVPIPAPPLRPTGVLGQMRSQFDSLGLGLYAVSVQPDTSVPLRCGYSWGSSAVAQTFDVERVADPAVGQSLAALGVVALGTAGLGAWSRAARRGRCKGWLYILDAQGRPVNGANYDLSGRKRHRFWVVKDIPGSVGTKDMRISNQANLATPCRILVEITPLVGSTWPPFPLSVPGANRNLITHNHTLIYVRNYTDIPQN